MDQRFASSDASAAFMLDTISEGLRSRGLQKAARSFEAGFSCLYDKVTKERPARVFRTPTPTLAGLASLTQDYEIDGQQFVIEAYRYAVDHEESHPMVDAFFVTALSAFAWANTEKRCSGVWQAAWIDMGPEIIWGTLLAGGSLIHPAISLGFAPLAFMHIRQRISAKQSQSSYLIASTRFYAHVLHAPQSWAALRKIATQATSSGVPLHPVIDLVLAKAERREARDPQSDMPDHTIHPLFL